MKESTETSRSDRPASGTPVPRWIEQSLMMALIVVVFIAAVAWLANLEQQLPDIRTPRNPGSSSELPGHALMMPGSPEIESVDPELNGDWVPQEIGEMDWLATDLQGSRMRAAFYGTELYMLARVGPDSSRAYVTVNDGPVEDLPQDELGSYVDLWASETSDQPILLASNLAHGEHIVEIAAGDDGELAIAGFEVVAATPFQWAFVLGYAGLGGGLFMVVRFFLYAVNQRNDAASSGQHDRPTDADTS